MIIRKKRYRNHIATYRVFIKYCFFFLKILDFSELCQFRCSAGFSTCLVCVHRGRREKDQRPEYFKIFGKNTIFNEHPVCRFPGKIIYASQIKQSDEKKRSQGETNLFLYQTPPPVAQSVLDNEQHTINRICNLFFLMDWLTRQSVLRAQLCSCLMMLLLLLKPLLQPL